MITSKELKYVSNWANRIPMPGYEYSKKVLNEMRSCIDIYNDRYRDKEYNLILSNSSELELKILSSNLCHMLGIDYSNITGPYFESYRKEVFKTTANLSSYELLNLILEYSDEIIKRDNDPSCPAKVVNYYKSGIKCEIFKKLSDFSNFNFAVLNNDNIETENPTYVDSSALDTPTAESSKYLFLPSNEPVCPYFMMGIKQNKDGEYYVFGLLAPDNPREFFLNKEVSIPTQILVSDCTMLSKLKATPTEKINLIRMYETLTKVYNIPNKLNILSDYSEMLLRNESLEQKVKTLKNTK